MQLTPLETDKYVTFLKCKRELLALLAGSTDPAATVANYFDSEADKLKGTRHGKGTGRSI